MADMPGSISRTRHRRIFLGREGVTSLRGTAAAPALAFEEDQTTGIYSSAASALDITVGGVQVQSFTAVASDTAIVPTTPPRVYVLTATITPTVTTSASVVEQTFTITGLGTTDTIIACNQPGTATAGAAIAGNTWFIAGVRVSAANTLAIAFGSIIGTPTPAAGTWRVVAVRSAS